MNGSDARLEYFKAYDVRGRVPEELDERVAELIGHAYAKLVRPRRVAVGHDVRLTSPQLAAALCRGLNANGVDVVDIGRVGTEEVYFATFSLKLDGGIMVTASHNPRDYNGMKFTRDLARPISADTGLLEMEETVRGALRSASPPGPGTTKASAADGGGGSVDQVDVRREYVEHLLTYMEPRRLKPLKVVVNAGNGGAGEVIDSLEPCLPLRFVKINHHPDGSFPVGVPNPLLPENRAVTSRVVLDEKADLGIAWDGDFDRCFFFDETGEFVEGYYLVGLLAQQALLRHPGSRIIHDPRLVWNTEEIVRAAGGVPVACKSGHAFIKEKMRAEDAAYGGEMSAHHYFKEFSYCDSGMIPWLQIVQAMSISGRPLSAMVSERIERYPVSGEINLTLDDPARALARLADVYEPGALAVDRMDGLSLEFLQWRCNVRSSNTEPVVRVNVETRGDTELLRSKTLEVIALLQGAD